MEEREGGGESALKLNIRIRQQVANERAVWRKKRKEEGGSEDVTDGQESDGVQAGEASLIFRLAKFEHPVLLTFYPSVVN